MKLLLLFAGICSLVYYRRKFLVPDILYIIRRSIVLYYKLFGTPKVQPTVKYDEADRVTTDVLLGFKKPSLDHFAFQALMFKFRKEEWELNEFRGMLANSPMNLPLDPKLASKKSGSTENGTKFLVIESTEAIHNGNFVIYIHGGGYVSGDAQSFTSFAVKLSKYTRSVVYCLDYQLCPEQTIKEQVDEAIDLYNMLLLNADHVVLVGDSAGGGLVYATLQRIKNENITAPQGAALFSPWLDIGLTGASVLKCVNRDSILSKGLLDLFQEVIFEKHGGLQAINEALHFDSSLEGLPPMYITASEEEMLYSDSVSLVRRARDAGCKVVFESALYGVHAYPVNVDSAPEYLESFCRICQFLRVHLQLESAINL